ncbi:MAG: thioesterase family protein [Acidimicrobiia bacterium]|nr:thioesterase family protein [Acidimicrobiia bacterium]
MSERPRALGDGGWLGLRPAGDRAWELDVVMRLCGRTGSFHGGCALAAATTAIEQHTGRPLVWATGQYLARAAVGEVVRVEVEVSSAGRSMTQARATSSVGERVLSVVLAGVGERPGPAARPLGAVPDVAAPEDSPPYELTWEAEGCFHRVIETRVARGAVGDSAVALWVRLPEPLQGTAAALAVFGDHVPTAIRWALRLIDERASSLDNNVRVFDLVPSEWLLVDVDALGTAHGVAHGNARFWTREGHLLGAASQSFAISPPAPPTSEGR